MNQGRELALDEFGEFGLTGRVTIWGCGYATGIQWVEAIDAAKPLTMCRTAPAKRIIHPSMSKAPRLRNPDLYIKTLISIYKVIAL